MYHFLEKLIAIVIPRMRDFRGLTPSSFDEFGNYSLGIDEQILFPEIDYSKIDKIRGLVATIVIRNSNKQKSQRLFELLGIPFKKN
ncbi:MAG: 50S ribosomal protein L5 [Candidatus Curtissbacteria bacterium GW2011_GWD1_40_8]|nr:MAG: 50S ribosomal protein L5 [Candidatus Curtissbacteria bacterium GW2011_GWD1_40_8]